jgi:uncharacterized protein
MVRESRTFKTADTLAVKPSLRDGAASRTITGYAARYDSWSGDLGGFLEIIRPGAFKKAVSVSDVRALWNHSDDVVLGRTKSGTLRLQDDGHGLRIEIDPPSWADNYLETIRRGDVDQMSFAFTVATGGDRWSVGADGVTRREIVEVAELFDVSPVTYPAYKETQVNVRELLEARGLTPSERRALRGILRPSVADLRHRLALMSLGFSAAEVDEAARLDMHPDTLRRYRRLESL